jgi:hypothetical protein
MLNPWVAVNERGREEFAVRCDDEMKRDSDCQRAMKSQEGAVAWEGMRNAGVEIADVDAGLNLNEVDATRKQREQGGRMWFQVRLMRGEGSVESGDGFACRRFLWR